MITAKLKAVKKTRPYRVALLIESSRGYGRSLLKGIAKFVRDHREWTVQYNEWTWIEDSPAWLQNWDGDGVIARIDTRKLAAIMQRLGIPVIDLRGSMTGLGLPLIDTDDKQVACLAAEHLMSLGFRHYAFCGFEGVNYSDNRSCRFQERLARAGFNCAVFNSPKVPGNLQMLEYEKRSLLFENEKARWLASLPKPVGIMACNDICGRKVINLCLQIGLVVPEEVAIIGVDNDEILCELSNPPLTSVAPDAVRIGYDAATLLQHLMEGGKPPDRPILVAPIGIVTRRSTDVLALDDRQLSAGLRFIRENAFHSINMDEASRAAGMSRRVFERRFATQVGLPPKAEVIRLRLERVKQLLAETDWTLAEIAEKTGFNHGEYLHTVFTHKNGITPGNYRRAHKKL